jgi:hypothetical protein
MLGNYEGKELDCAGFVLVVEVHCMCIVEYETLFTSYLPFISHLYLGQLAVTFVTRNFIQR